MQSIKNVTGVIGTVTGGCKEFKRNSTFLR